MKHLTKLAAAASLMALSTPAVVYADAHIEAATAEAEAIRVYTAEQFYNSTSFGLGDSSGFVFSADGEHILVNSDATGIFNAYLMPVTGGEPTPLTTSTSDATFGNSFFPADNRVLFEDEGHGFRNKSNRIEASQAYFDFLEEPIGS